ncbi:MAG: (2Fe-2S) ferredoxin domain-containing protein [Clostridia bacterium]
MNIQVCVGSSCHLKGSYNIIEMFKAEIAARHLEEQVNLAAAFCLGKCTNGVTIKVDDDFICGVSVDNFSEIFENKVLAKL